MQWIFFRIYCKCEWLSGFFQYNNTLSWRTHEPIYVICWWSIFPKRFDYAWQMIYGLTLPVGQLSSFYFVRWNQRRWVQWKEFKPGHFFIGVGSAPMLTVSPHSFCSSISFHTCWVHLLFTFLRQSLPNLSASLNAEYLLICITCWIWRTVLCLFNLLCKSKLIYFLNGYKIVLCHCLTIVRMPHSLDDTTYYDVGFQTACFLSCAP